MTMLPGPVSNAITPSNSARGGRNVRLPMPPIFCTMRGFVWSVNSAQSAYGTSGAPSPPAAMSRTRKSATVVMPVRSAMTAASPICSVEGVPAFGR